MIRGLLDTEVVSSWTLFGFSSFGWSESGHYLYREGIETYRHDQRARYRHGIKQTYWGWKSFSVQPFRASMLALLLQWLTPGSFSVRTKASREEVKKHLAWGRNWREH